MRRHTYLLASMLLAIGAAVTATAAQAETIDIKRGVPEEVYLAIYSKHNPERDYQREYWKEIREAVEETEIVQKFMKIATSRIPGEELDEAKAVIDKLKAALEPIDVDELLDTQEAIYAQKMEGMTSQHLGLLRMTPDAAARVAKGITNLFRLLEEMSEGGVTAHVDEDTPGQPVSLVLPPEVPFRPTVAHHQDVLVISSSADLAAKSLQSLIEGSGQSKFDDPRLTKALEELPEAEDAIIFYDGRTQFEQMRGMVNSLAERDGLDNPEAKRWLGIANRLFDELSILDYEVTVEYTEDNLNRSAAVGQLLEGSENSVLMKAFGNGRPFNEWHQWVPAEATRYSLSRGANLHPVYEFVMTFMKENIPESHEMLERFAEWQDENDLHIDKDILQAFSGESVSVSIPAAVPTMFSSEQSFTAVRCEDPDGIRKLLHRLVEHLKEHPMIESQQLKLSESEDLDGFEELSATIFSVFGVRPVIGFRDGWMICGSSKDAVQQVFETRAGERPSVTTTDAFKEFRLDIEGSVQSISYSDMARSTRQSAAMLNQAGVIMPMVIGMMGAEMNAEQLKPVQEIVGLLPSVGKIVAKFDFLEAKLSVTQDAGAPGRYIRRSVVRVRPPAEPDAEAEVEEVE